MGLAFFADITCNYPTDLVVQLIIIKIFQSRKLSELSFDAESLIRSFVVTFVWKIRVNIMLYKSNSMIFRFWTILMDFNRS